LSYITISHLRIHVLKIYQGHKLEMLENYAQIEVSKVGEAVIHLENSIRIVKEKLELRKNLNEKKEIAAK